MSRTRFILGTSVALVMQVCAGNAQSPGEAPPPQPQLPMEARMIEPIMEAAPVEPVTGELSREPGVVKAGIDDGKQPVPTEAPPRRWRLTLGLNASALYDDNIYLQERNKQGDFVFTLSPLLGMEYGDPARNFLALLYSPRFLFFAEHSGENAVEHAVSFRTTRDTDRWKMEANLEFRSYSGTNGGGSEQPGERVGERVDRRTYTAGTRATYLVSGKTSVEVSFTGNYTDYDEFADTLDLVNLNYIDYKVTGKTTVGLGFGVGYAKSEGGPSQVYEQANLRVNYQPTAKLAFTANGGVEFRQVDGGEKQVTGVFGAGVGYKPFEQTTIGLDAYRRVRPSAVEAEANYVVTGIAVSARQRFLRKFYTTVVAGYENTEYEALTGGAEPVREEDYFFLRPSVEFRLRERARVELFYEYRSNESTRGAFDFSNTRAGINFGLSF